MNELDILVLIVLGLSALLGLVRGMLTEVLSLVVWLLALLIAVLHGDAVAARFVGIEEELLRNVAGYAATFVVCVLFGNLLVWLLRSLLHGAGLSVPDRLLGLLFGLLRGAAIVLAAVMLADLTPAPQAKIWRVSLLLPMFEEPARWLAPRLPDADAVLDFIGGDAATPEAR